jgi:hypothetical protein
MDVCNSFAKTREKCTVHSVGLSCGSTSLVHHLLTSMQFYEGGTASASSESSSEEDWSERESDSEEEEHRAGRAPLPTTGPYRGTGFKPWWRTYTTCYVEKPKRLVLRLLCALSRTKDLILPQGVPDGSGMRIEFLKDPKKPAASPVSCMQALGELVRGALQISPAPEGSDKATQVKHTATIESKLAKALVTDDALEGLYPEFLRQIEKCKVTQSRMFRCVRLFTTACTPCSYQLAENSEQKRLLFLQCG